MCAIMAKYDKEYAQDVVVEGVSGDYTVTVTWIELLPHVPRKRIVKVDESQSSSSSSKRVKSETFGSSDTWS